MRHILSWFEASLPDGLDTLAEVVEDVAVLGPFTDVDAATCWKETTDDAGDVTADVECLRIIHTDAFYA